jgi:hypothetical protein
VPGYSKAVVSVDAADIAAWDSVPSVLIAAPGAGRYISPKAFDVVMTKATNVWNARGTFHLGLGPNVLGVGGVADALQGTGVNQAGDGTNTVSLNVPITGSGNHWAFGSAAAEDEPLTISCDGSLLGGPILTSSVADGGSGYAPGDTGTIDDPASWGFDATYVVDTVDGSGAVLTFTVTNPGAGGYGVGVSPTSAPSGGGSGFTIDVTSVVVGDSPCKFVIYYTVEDL